MAIRSRAFSGQNTNLENRLGIHVASESDSSSYAPSLYPSFSICLVRPQTLMPMPRPVLPPTLQLLAPTGQKGPPQRGITSKATRGTGRVQVFIHMKRGRCSEGSGTAELSASCRPADAEEVFQKLMRGLHGCESGLSFAGTRCSGLRRYPEVILREQLAIALRSFICRDCKAVGGVRRGFA